MENIPHDFLAKLKSLYLVNLKINLKLEKELLNIIHYFKENDITIIPLKGPVLARFLYGDLSLRGRSGDLDLLIKKEQLKEAEEALGKIGFNPNRESADIFWRSFNLKYYREIGFIRSTNRLLVELHLDLRGLFSYPPLEDFWSGLREFDLDGERILMPSNEDLLTYLCLVAMPLTEFIELRYLYDIHTLISKFGKDLNW